MVLFTIYHGKFSFCHKLKKKEKKKKRKEEAIHRTQNFLFICVKYNMGVSKKRKRKKESIIWVNGD